MRDPYAVLGVSRDASADEIRRKYKKLARKHHPDVAKSDADAERFKEINAAYDVLGDEERRKLYDEFGEISLKPGFDPDKARAWKRAGGGFAGGGFPGGGFGGFGGFGADGPDFSGGFGGFDGFGGGDPQDILGSIFGRRARRGPRKGQDIDAEVRVSLLDVARGDPVTISLRRPVLAGSGGQATLVMQEETVKVRLPPGVRDGQTIRLRGKGGDSPTGGPPGDLRLTVRVTEPAGLRRVGDNIELDVPITFAEALTGAQITVPTFDGDVKLTVPAGAQAGQKLRLRGKGIPLRKGRGDLIVVLHPTAPRRVDGDRVRALADELAALYDEDVRARLPL